MSKTTSFLKRAAWAAAALGILMGLAACGGGGGGHGMGDAGGTPPGNTGPPPDNAGPASEGFFDFLRRMIAQAPPDSEPWPVEGVEAPKGDGDEPMGV